MKSKFKLMMVAAAAIVGSSGAFAAATAITCATEATTLTKLVNGCAPEVTFFVSGASAQKAALDFAVKNSGIFDLTKTKGILTSAGTTVSAKNTTAYIGYGGSALGDKAGKRVLIVYNSGNGSGAGVGLLLTGKGTGSGEEIQMVTSTVKDLAKGISGVCDTIVEKDASSADFSTAKCPNELKVSAGWGGDAQKKIHMALSDVRPNELAPGVVKSWKPATFPATTTALQGFGIAVSPMLYKALQAKDVTAGRIASSCNDETVGGGNASTDTTSGLCQPSISRAEYASIITGKIKGVDDLTGNGDTTATLYLARRVNSSGSQAASNIAFANQAGYNVKADLNKMAEIKTAVGSPFTLPGGSATLVVTEGSGTGDVLTVLRNTATFAIGVVSLENVYTQVVDTTKGLRGALYVKIDGMSPNYSCSSVSYVPTCTLDSKQRVSLQKGYPLAYEAVTIQSSTLGEPYKTIAKLITDGLGDASQSDLAGMAYFKDSTGDNPAAKMTSFGHGTSNYLPLVKN